MSESTGTGAAGEAAKSAAAAAKPGQTVNMNKVVPQICFTFEEFQV
jgi:hypothetical protein